MKRNPAILTIVAVVGILMQEVATTAHITGEAASAEIADGHSVAAADDPDERRSAACRPTGIATVVSRHRSRCRYPSRSPGSRSRLRPGRRSTASGPASQPASIRLRHERWLDRAGAPRAQRPGLHLKPIGLLGAPSRRRRAVARFIVRPPSAASSIPESSS